jgi:hypothetical protein
VHWVVLVNDDSDGSARDLSHITAVPLEIWVRDLGIGNDEIDLILGDLTLG